MVSEDAARKRVDRGLERLRKYLQTHDLPVAATLLTIGVMVPPEFDFSREILLRSISQGIAPDTVLTVTAARQLTSEVLRSMLMTKLKLTAACAVALGGAISAAPYVMAQGAGHGFAGEGLVQMPKADKKTTVVEPSGIHETGEPVDAKERAWLRKGSDGLVAVRVSGMGKHMKIKIYKSDGKNLYGSDGKMPPDQLKKLKANGLKL